MSHELVLKIARMGGRGPFEVVVDNVRYAVISSDGILPQSEAEARVHLNGGWPGIHEVGHYDWYTYFPETQHLISWSQATEGDPTAANLSVLEAMSLITVRPIIMIKVEPKPPTDGIENYTVTKYFIHGPPL